MTVSHHIRDRISDLFLSHELLGASQIADLLQISRVSTHQALPSLLLEGKIRKVGSGSHTRYQSLIFRGVETTSPYSETYIPDYQTSRLLTQYFYKFTPDGAILSGVEGMRQWCESRGYPWIEKIESYLSIYQHLERLRDECGLLDASHIFGQHFDTVALDRISYADQYKWMEFGRGRLAEMTFYAKQSQNRALIEQSIGEILPKLECMIRRQGFDALAIVPWSIDRKNQLLGILKHRLAPLGLPYITITKRYRNHIAIPQKSLKLRDQRIQNARDTIFVEERNIKKYHKVLLIDDFVGSGSTLNETAKKLREKGVSEVVGFAFVGNLNLEYEIVNEV